ncbi:MoaD/ThiS family protein [Chloroflexota bacterium]
MKKVEVKLYADLRRYYPKLKVNEALTITLDDGANLGNLLDELKIPREEITMTTINGKQKEEGYLLQNGDRAGIFPLIGGG